MLGARSGNVSSRFVGCYLTLLGERPIHQGPLGPLGFLEDCLGIPYHSPRDDLHFFGIDGSSGVCWSSEAEAAHSKQLPRHVGPIR